MNNYPLANGSSAESKGASSHEGASHKDVPSRKGPSHEGPSHEDTTFHKDSSHEDTSHEDTTSHKDSSHEDTTSHKDTSHEGASSHEDSSHEDTSSQWQEGSAKKPQPNVFRRYRVRHIVLAVVVVLLCAYYALRAVRSVADVASTYVAHTWQRIFGRIFDAVPFSVAELLCALVLTVALIYLLVSLCKIVRKPDKLQRAYGAFITILTGALTIFMLICWLWSISFYSHTFTELSGIDAEELSVEELKEVTLYFAEEVNRAAEAVERGEDGLYICDTQTIFSESPALYTNLPEEFHFLEGSNLHPKPLLSSYLMSLSGFTGVFFPLTGEANINIHAPDCFIPATVAHELAHQRGVAREQDANFTAVLVCMESEDVHFNYSGALLAYTHLSNALREAHYEDWVAVSASLGEDARRDLLANNEYWAQLQTPIADVSEAVYEEFLYSQGQEMGMRSYGACVDLLVAYYGDAAGSR